MLRPYVPIILVVLFVLANAVLLPALSHFLSNTRTNPAKETPYESGMPVLEADALAWAECVTVHEIEPGHARQRCGSRQRQNMGSRHGDDPQAAVTRTVSTTLRI